MKRKTRTITVNNKQYIWWYTFNENTVSLILSPANDKTSTITVMFSVNVDSHKVNDHPIAVGCFPEYISIQKDDENYCIKTIEPHMVNLMLTILSDNAFESRKNIVYNGQELLTETGYAITDIRMGMYW